MGVRVLSALLLLALSGCIAPPAGDKEAASPARVAPFAWESDVAGEVALRLTLTHEASGSCPFSVALSGEGNGPAGFYVVHDERSVLELGGFGAPEPAAASAPGASTREVAMPERWSVARNAQNSWPAGEIVLELFARGLLAWGSPDSGNASLRLEVRCASELALATTEASREVILLGDLDGASTSGNVPASRFASETLAFASPRVVAFGFWGGAQAGSLRVAGPDVDETWDLTSTDAAVKVRRLEGAAGEWSMDARFAGGGQGGALGGFAPIEDLRALDGLGAPRHPE